MRFVGVQLFEGWEGSPYNSSELSELFVSICLSMIQSRIDREVHKSEFPQNFNGDVNLTIYALKASDINEAINAPTQQPQQVRNIYIPNS
jgi:hypothetical protein